MHTCEPFDGQAFESRDEIAGHEKQPCILVSESQPYQLGVLTAQCIYHSQI